MVIMLKATYERLKEANRGAQTQRAAENARLRTIHRLGASAPIPARARGQMPGRKDRRANGFYKSAGTGKRRRSFLRTAMGGTPWPAPSPRPRRVGGDNSTGEHDGD